MLHNVKPSSRTKREEILNIARKHPKLKTLLKGRNRAVFVEPNITDRGQPDGANQAVVGLYDYAHNRSVVALLDPKRKKVLSVEETSAHFQLDEEEQKEAEALAAKDARVRAFLGRRKMNPLTRLYFPPGAGGDRPPHRYAIVFLRPNSSERRYAVVDLSERKVLDVLAPEALTTD